MLRAPFGGLETNAWSWQTLAGTTDRRSGHSMFSFNQYNYFSRYPEKLDQSNPSDTWHRLTTTPRLFKQFYPQVFSMADGNAFIAGPSVSGDGASFGTWKLNVSTGAWTALPSSGAGFSGGSAVMYAPGKVMKCGSRDSENWYESANNLSAWIDLTATTPQWHASSTDMLHQRVNHNLTILPGGEVLATGGTERIDNSANQDPVYEPELWHPPDAQGQNEGWYTGPNGSLGVDNALIRGYHSVSLLLPDGRVLTAGGYGDNNPDLYKVNIYCPPYLFKADGTPAPRPVIVGCPTNFTWGKTVTVCVQDDPAGISGACLIRPGAVTHGFDQNQRYTELTITGRAGDGTTADPYRIFVTAPASAAVTTPGYQLLFVYGSGSTYPDVPSIAKWVRIDDPTEEDVCDVVTPGASNDLGPDVIGSSEVWLTWAAPADDATILGSGPTQSYASRYAPFNINTDNAWGMATPVSTLPTPGWPGTCQSLHVSGLQPCTDYHFALRSTDDHGHQSGIPQNLTVQTTCNGGAGEYSAQRTIEYAHARGLLSTSSAEIARTVTEPLRDLPAALGTLIVSTTPAEDGVWQVRLRLASGSSAPDGITVVQDDTHGTPDTLGHFDPDTTESVLGLCSLRARGRVGVSGVYELGGLSGGLRTPGGDFVLVAANHSRLGELRADWLASSGVVDFGSGDSLVLTYAPTADAGSSASSWYALIRRIGNAPVMPMSQHRTSETPSQFALHPSRPNPAEGAVSINFDLPVETRVALEVFDLLGRRVATLATGSYPAGAHAATWDLHDTSGTKVRPGVYVYRLSAGTFHERRKMNVLR